MRYPSEVILEVIDQQLCDFPFAIFHNRFSLSIMRISFSKLKKEQPDLLRGHRHEHGVPDAGASESHAGPLHVHGFINHSDDLWFRQRHLQPLEEIFKFV
jgi:hypothetical protein